MPDQPTLHAKLFSRLLEGKLSPDDINELIQWLGSPSPDKEAVQVVLQHLKQANIDEKQLTPELKASLEARLPLIFDAAEQSSTPVLSIFRKKWMRYAAGIILVLGLGAYLYISNRPAASNEQTAIAQAIDEKEILPGTDGAILTLEDGSTMILDSLGNGLLTTQGGTKVLLRNGQLVYEAGDINDIAVGFNTMTTPKGRQFQLVLPDGSKVWLNAASSIRYPTVFSDKERKVEITGEAYFEVVKNTKKPFRVRVNEQTEVEVLGTHFNVNSYDNEESINTTLLEGSVRIVSDNKKLLLAPGQQARTSSQSGTEIVDNVDTEKVMAWKNGLFNFQDASLEEVMRQLERWYDIEVVYEKNIPKLEFFGKMGKDLSLETVLRGLEKSNVHFRIEAGRKLVVLP